MSDWLRLFYHRHLYDIAGTEALFFRAIRENVRHHLAHCPEYVTLVDRQGFSADVLRSPEDLSKIPPLPTLYLKRRPLYSMRRDHLVLKSTTSGTSGQASIVGLDRASVLRGLGMVMTTLRAHRLISPRPTNYIVLGYQPAKRNKIGAVRTAYATTFVAPPRHREYALRDTGEAYELNISGLRHALVSYEKQGCPVRFIGFPAYFRFLLTDLQRNGIRLRLHPKSLVMLGGGWKQFFAERIEKTALYALSAEILGIDAMRIREFFGVVEHQVPYLDCPNHHFHIPIYARVIIRDVNTLEPVDYGTPGLLNLLTPIITSMPLTSVMTDDLATLYPGIECGCGIDSPFFEIHGRADATDIITCATGAAELLADIVKKADR